MIKRSLLLLTLCFFAATGYVAAQSAKAPKQAPPAKPAPAKPRQPKGGQQQTYGLGDQMFVINAGLFAPLFFQSESGTVFPTNLTLGATGSLELDVFLNNNLTAGVNFGGAFSFSPNKHALFLIPITAKLSWIFHIYPFDFPVSLGAGVNFMRLDNQFYIGPIVRPGVGGYWNVTSKWSLGVRAAYWWVPEVYFGPSPPASRSRFGNFFELSLSALYHF